MRSNPLQTRLHRFNPWPCACGFGFRVVFCTVKSLTHTSEYDGCVVCYRITYCIPNSFMPGYLKTYICVCYLYNSSLKNIHNHMPKGLVKSIAIVKVQSQHSPTQWMASEGSVSD
jgi:hypothetical protein